MEKVELEKDPSPMIRVVNLAKKFGDFVAVDGINFEVKRGEVFGFLGPNGAGKTTTIRMIAGLVQASAGHIEIDGRDIQAFPIHVKAITGFIPDRPYIYEKLTAWEFLRFVGGLYSLKDGEIALRSEELLRRFGLWQWADRLIENFSHGMKQRLVFCSALLPQPRLLIVDEPMVGLDPQGAKLVKALFRELCEDQELSVFVSTHTLEVAEEVCDRIAIMNHGNIVAMGSMDELRDQAQAPTSALEDIFLQMTMESEA